MIDFRVGVVLDDPHAHVTGEVGARLSDAVDAVAAAVGLTPAGLPAGAQVIGPRFEDDTPITFAELLADVVGGYRPPPIAMAP